MFNFNLKKFILNDNEWSTLKCDIDFNSKGFAKAVSQAKAKSIHTMNASQDGSYRSPEIKYNMQLMGIIAEMSCERYLRGIIKKSKLNESVEIIRYDDVRTDEFKSPENEYDIKILFKNSDTSLKVESRSSITYNRSFQDGLEKFDIIGSYSSIAKNLEADNDIYLRPLYRYLNFNSERYSKLKFDKLLKVGSFELYIVAGCTIDEMKSKGYLKSMSQEGTTYRVLPIRLSSDIVTFSKKIIEKLKMVDEN